MGKALALQRKAQAGITDPHLRAQAAGRGWQEGRVGKRRESATPR